MRRILLAAATALILGGTGPAPAALPVIDARAIAQLLLDYERQGLILKQEVDTYLHLLDNAKGLADLDRFLRRLGLSAEEMTADLVRLILNEAYNLDPDSPVYNEELREIQQDRYILPRTEADAAATYQDLYAPDDAARMAEGYEQYRRDYEEYGQYSRALNGALGERERTLESMMDQQETLATLGDNNMAATLQAIAAQNALLHRQMDILLQLAGVSADQQIQDQLRQIEREVSIAEQKIEEAERRRQFRETPHVDITRWPLTYGGGGYGED